MGRKPFPFTEEHLAMMGKVPDAEVAKLAGCVGLTVSNYRAQHGIPRAPRASYRAPKRVYHAAYTRFIGVIPDADIADVFKVSRQAVGLARRCRDLASPENGYPLVSAAFAIIDGAEVGKTRVTVPKSLYDALVAATTPKKEAP